MSTRRSIRFIETIGKGGFGAVYLAEVQGRGGFTQRLAVKVLSEELSGSADVAARHRDEARLLGLLNHDQIVKVFDMVELAGRPALLMEYVEGADCGALMRQGPLPPRAAFEIAQAVASALHFGWSTVDPASDRPLQVVHRDIKPANLLISRHGGVKVLDFGIARGDFDREGRTESVQFGTARYMAPEYSTSTTTSYSSSFSPPPTEGCAGFVTDGPTA